MWQIQFCIIRVINAFRLSKYYGKHLCAAEEIPNRNIRKLNRNTQKSVHYGHVVLKGSKDFIHKMLHNNKHDFPCTSLQFQTKYFQCSFTLHLYARRVYNLSKCSMVLKWIPFIKWHVNGDNVKIRRKFACKLSQ